MNLFKFFYGIKQICYCKKNDNNLKKNKQIIAIFIKNKKSRNICLSNKNE